MRGETTMGDLPSRTYDEPAVLWRLRHPNGDVARAMLIPGSPTSTLVYFVNDQFERGENFAEWGPAVEQAERVKRQMIGEGWREEAP